MDSWIKFLCFFRKRVVLTLIFLFSLLYFLLQFNILQLIRFNKRYQDGEFEEISYKRDSPLIWRSLKEFNLTDSKEICKNSKQGPKFIVDERGFVCELSDLLTTGCCDIDSEKTKLYQCESCNAANCCQIYEYCVSCCNNPDKVPMLEKLIAKANDRQSLLFSSISDQFSLCLSLCRTNSNSLKNENRYRSEYKHCFSKTEPHESIIPVI